MSVVDEGATRQVGLWHTFLSFFSLAVLRFGLSRSCFHPEDLIILLLLAHSFPPSNLTS